MLAFDFTPEDLDANHNNYMSKRQRAKLNSRRRISPQNILQALYAYGLLFVIMTLCWLAIVIPFISSKTPLESLSPIWWILLCGCWGLSAIPALVLLWPVN